MTGKLKLVLWFEECRRDDVAIVGGKNASLGEMVSNLTKTGIKVPPGFATTSTAYWQYLEANKLSPVISEAFSKLESGSWTLAKTGSLIRRSILKGKWPDLIAKEICASYTELSKRSGQENVDVAVRSSATAEDLPDASFAGQQESFLNVQGADALLEACRMCYASLFTDRAISYRIAKGFDHSRVALSVGVQTMVHSDKGGSGVMFSLDTETGFEKVVVINAAWGLGENIVKGIVDPDEYIVFKPFLSNSKLVPIIERKIGSKTHKLIYGRGKTPTRNVPTSKIERSSAVLSDVEVCLLAHWACEIEEHYGCPIDIEWARDGVSNELFVVQARPETVQSQRNKSLFQTYKLRSKGEVLVQGLSIGGAVVTGEVCLIEDAKDIDDFVDGSILVASTTDPDWVPLMKRARGLVTDHGGRTSHAAIVSRELGLPAIVGTGDATHRLHSSQEITISCAEGDEGFVYEGAVAFESETVELSDIPTTKTEVMLNLANPAAAFQWAHLPTDGVGLARMEFVISNHIRVHPLALVHFDRLKDEKAKREISDLTAGFENRTDYFVDKLAMGLARIAATVHPKPVIVRMSDFKSNEYANLLGGAQFEPEEANPMIGFRGASRYYSADYEAGFALECAAIVKLREHIGFENVIVMIPFCRSPLEADRVLEAMENNGLKRGKNGLQVFVMCEIPSNVILAKEFSKRFDGFSIGSNDLTQLTLGVDRDSEALAELFDEQDPAVKWMIKNVIKAAHNTGSKVGLCGQAPSDHPKFAGFLVNQSIDSISVTPDSFISVKKHVAAAEDGKSR